MGVNRLRHKLVLVFLAATLLPLAAILWMSSALMSRSLAFVATDDVATLAGSLEGVGREYYRQTRQHLKDEAISGRLDPQRLAESSRAGWPAPLQHFWDSSEAERFILSEPDGERLHYAVRRDHQLWLYTTSLDGVRMGEITRQIREARARAGELRQRNLPRGFTLALVLSSALVWVFSLSVVFYLSIRISRPIQQLTAGLGDVAAGRFGTRLQSTGRDEIGLAIEAFNQTAGHLQQSRDRLVYLTQVASWQLLARKMAHELKNSLTPIRLTVEEIVARQSSAGPEFFEQAAAIVVDEVTSLERRVRAFSEFAAEPEVHPARLDLDAIVRERVQFLRGGHPGVSYQVASSQDAPTGWADGDHVKGIVTNLLENAAEAAGDGGVVLAVAGRSGHDAVVEVHDSGPGVSGDARARLFEPSISFKKHGMGLGLAISRKNALLAGGDLTLIEGRLGGAGFRLAIPTSERAER
ncbi:MAG TPA: HAMP domain-containing sensor histidine kinase [Vicinamibacterales bacterium]|jgi:nitrogen fixation/metabolism regulation signal transduction histidine kinase